MNTTRDWQCRCTKCGKTKNLTDVSGAARIGAWSFKKFTLGWCKGCRRPRFIAIERVPHRAV